MPKRVLNIEFDDENEYKEIMQAVKEEAEKHKMDTNDFLISIIDDALFEDVDEIIGEMPILETEDKEIEEMGWPESDKKDENL